MLDGTAGCLAKVRVVVCAVNIISGLVRISVLILDQANDVVQTHATPGVREVVHGGWSWV